MFLIAWPYEVVNIHLIWCRQWFWHSITIHLTTLLLCFSIAQLTCCYQDVVSVSSGLHNLQVTIGRPSWWNHTMRHIIKSHTMKFLVLSQCFLTAWPYEITNIHLMLWTFPHTFYFISWLTFSFLFLPSIFTFGSDES